MPFSSMTFRPVMVSVLLLLLALFCSRVEVSATSQVVTGKVSCLDCDSHYDLSGIKVLLKCDKPKMSATSTTTDSKGCFDVELPTSSETPTSLNCLAMLLGGPGKLYASRSKMVSRIVNAPPGSSSSYTTSTALAFSTARPSAGGTFDAAGNDVGSSKTVDLPLPREWGLPPSSYYVPIIPIIGIP